MDGKHSFSIYMAYGGTNFGYWAGANYDKVYLGHVTSYDYNAPINELGKATDKFMSFRNLIS
jgi:beta-galactosidase